MACRLCGHEGTAIVVRIEDLTYVKQVRCSRCGLLLETRYEPIVKSVFISDSCGCGAKV